MTKRDRLHSSRTVSVKSLVSGLSKLNTIGTKPRLRSFSRKRSKISIRPSVKRPNRSTFFFDGVDNVANLLVVEQEINELRDLDVVDFDFEFPTSTDRLSVQDAKAFLYSSVELQIPGRQTIYGALLELRVSAVRPRQLHPLQVGLNQLGLPEIGFIQVRSTEVCIGKISVIAFGLREDRLVKARPL